MSDKNLRETLSGIIGCAPQHVDLDTIYIVKAAIAKDKEEVEKQEEATN